MGQVVRVTFPGFTEASARLIISPWEREKQQNQNLVDRSRQAVLLGEEGSAPGGLDLFYERLGSVVNQEYWQGVHLETSSGLRPDQKQLLREAHDHHSELVRTMRNFFEGRSYTEGWLKALKPALRKQVLREIGECMAAQWRVTDQGATANEIQQMITDERLRHRLLKEIPELLGSASLESLVDIKTALTGKYDKWPIQDNQV